MGLGTSDKIFTNCEGNGECGTERKGDGWLLWKSNGSVAEIATSTDRSDGGVLLGRSEGRNRGEDGLERLLWCCCSGGNSMNNDSSSKSVGFWNIRANSSLTLDTDRSEADCASLATRLVEGAIVEETPSRWAPKMTR